MPSSLKVYINSLKVATLPLIFLLVPNQSHQGCVPLTSCKIKYKTKREKGAPYWKLAWHHPCMHLSNTSSRLLHSHWCLDAKFLFHTKHEVAVEDKIFITKKKEFVFMSIKEKASIISLSINFSHILTFKYYHEWQLLIS